MTEAKGQTDMIEGGGVHMGEIQQKDIKEGIQVKEKEAKILVGLMVE